MSERGERITAGGPKPGAGAADTGDMPPGVAALTPEQLRALVDVSRRARKIRRAGAVARFGGWTGAVFAAITLVSAVFSFALSTVFIGAGLALVAAGEFHGAALLRRLDPRGPRHLALNQVLLAAVLCGYAAWCLIAGPGAVQQSSGSAEVDAMVA